jgi:hypothetical protein
MVEVGIDEFDDDLRPLCKESYSEWKSRAITTIDDEAEDWPSWDSLYNEQAFNDWMNSKYGAGYTEYASGAADLGSLYPNYASYYPSPMQSTYVDYQAWLDDISTRLEEFPAIKNLRVKATHDFEGNGQYWAGRADRMKSQLIQKEQLLTEEGFQCLTGNGDDDEISGESEEPSTNDANGMKDLLLPIVGMSLVAGVVAMFLIPDGS